VLFVHLEAPAAMLDARLRSRPGHYMPPALLTSQLETLEPLAPDEPGAVLSTEAGAGQVVADILALLEPGAI
jgi:gluconokinase